MDAYSHYQAAERELERAHRIANHKGRYQGDRDIETHNALAAAQVHATLACCGDIELRAHDDERLHSVKA